MLPRERADAPRPAYAEIPLQGATTSATGALRSPDGRERQVTWEIAEEAPAALRYNGTPYAVMMVTPSDLGDFAVGFSVTEAGIAAGEIDAVAVRAQCGGYAIDIACKTPPAAGGGRSIPGRSGCGLCGVATLAEAIRGPRPVSRPFRPDPDAVAAALAALPDWQPMNARNHSVHAAAWATADGRIVACREDVGRHNALDKLIGTLLPDDSLDDDGFALMSSRCSFELVQKAAAVGIPFIASVSAPTALALSLSRACGIGLAARAPDGVMQLSPSA